MRKKTYKVALLKQKLAGIVMIAAGIISVPVCEMDATAALLLVPIGITCLLTSEIFIEH